MTSDPCEGRIAEDLRRVAGRTLRSAISHSDGLMLQDGDEVKLEVAEFARPLVNHLKVVPDSYPTIEVL